jgi:hypothetical protein
LGMLPNLAVWLVESLANSIVGLCAAVASVT